MVPNQKVPNYNKNFVGRSRELEWLEEQIHARRRDFEPIIISGPPGIGKTSLINHLLSSRRWAIQYESMWFDLLGSLDIQENLKHVLESLRAEPSRSATIVILDNADHLNNDEISYITKQIFNYKRVRRLIISTRRTPTIENGKVLHLDGLDQVDVKSLLEKLEVDEEVLKDLSRLREVTQSSPIVLTVLSELLKKHDKAFLDRLFSGNLYDISENTSQTQIIKVVKPRIISAQEELVLKLKNQPESLFSISPRNFEEALAEILEDLGFEVELTKATRDGGKDILAYLDTPIGKRLCLVDAKRYRKTRKVGVDLVRTLYGTLCHYQANSAMLVTTSSFTKDARAFQQKHSYQLELRDFSDIVEWLQNYRQGSQGS